eukprot:3080105-Rhodomonas_salina.2
MAQQAVWQPHTSFVRDESRAAGLAAGAGAGAGAGAAGAAGGYTGGAGAGGYAGGGGGGGGGRGVIMMELGAPTAHLPGQWQGPGPPAGSNQLEQPQAGPQQHVPVGYNHLQQHWQHACARARPPEPQVQLELLIVK